MLFIEGRDAELESSLVGRMNALATEMKFEEAEISRRRLERILKAREEYADTFFSVANFDFIAVLAAASTSRRKMAFIRQGRIVGFEEYDIVSLRDALTADLQRLFAATSSRSAADNQYDEFCLVSNFIVDPLQSVDLVRVHDGEDVAATVLELIERKRKRRSKGQEPPTTN
jgi:excinuclease UvrABC nuclease subunit